MGYQLADLQLEHPRAMRRMLQQGLIFGQLPKSGLNCTVIVVNLFLSALFVVCKFELASSVSSSEFLPFTTHFNGLKHKDSSKRSTKSHAGHGTNTIREGKDAPSTHRLPSL